MKKGMWGDRLPYRLRDRQTCDTSSSPIDGTVFYRGNLRIETRWFQKIVQFTDRFDIVSFMQKCSFKEQSSFASLIHEMLPVTSSSPVFTAVGEGKKKTRNEEIDQKLKDYYRLLFYFLLLQVCFFLSIPDCVLTLFRLAPRQSLPLVLFELKPPNRVKFTEAKDSFSMQSLCSKGYRLRLQKLLQGVSLTNMMLSATAAAVVLIFLN